MILLAIFYMQVHGTSYENPRLVRATSISALHIPGAMWRLASRDGSCMQENTLEGSLELIGGKISCKCAIFRVAVRHSANPGASAGVNVL